MTKLLITDDAAFMRMTLKNMVTAAGYEVVAEAENGAQAIELYNEHQPDLVTMDITMPEMNGIEALEKIKETDPSAKIVMCSAMGQQNMVVDAIQKGAADFIVKPFDENRIKEALDKALSR
ncbi:response regulator [Salisediminibacterium halotolerans]|uniref:Two-component system, chemotaxis family, response regulator CheY n=1 Tax=Salisediminibacterium halotolerans TaxID=517425 RepID=A0A1H9WPN2_9BACI|nr:MULTISPECIES: response regulator [Salisediminibacterium]RLJ69660.1 two-component system chemotaxis response regulator CheY [Actinophytocola xinjiangensis]RPE89718.1 two-component system chemotaxis response regulator CheY [Salisediminibacterium halotolerans]TWG32554.1 two-component system chemotaxis response regulator CheY [Salisediminibacterium halotolerans]SES35896.1 two-component system, chemotaxis family, response regulator CheY [Salisediminibacterium haloalkalitolerans]GEL08445.1 chemot